MAFVGWYFVAGVSVLAGWSFYLQAKPIDDKLKSEITLAFGGIVMLVLWPMVFSAALLNAWRKKSPDE